MSKINVLLADDDKDDRYFFARALKNIPLNVNFKSVNDGELLMKFLSEAEELPDVIFLDLNMPRKTGNECLVEIKKDEKLKNIPVVIYSTSLHDEVADVLYKNGAHYYLQKCNFSVLPDALTKVLSTLTANPSQPSREKFIVKSLVA